MLTAELSKGDQTYQRIVLEVNSSFVFSSNALPAGTYDLKVSGEHSTFALLGVERESGDYPLDIIEHRIEQRLDGRSVMGFVGEPGETVTFVNPGKTAIKVRITKEPESHLADEVGYKVVSVKLTDEDLAPEIKDLPGL